MSSLITELKQKRLVWSATEQPCNHTNPHTLSGYPELDNQLAEGFPNAGMIEIAAQLGIGELRLVLPYIKALANSGKLVVFISPPCHINATMLQAYGFTLSQCLLLTPSSETDALWCAEQCLRSAACASVLLWHSEIQIHQAKRLQLAAENSETLQLLFHPPHTQSLSLPVALRLSLHSAPEGIRVTVERQKRGWPLPTFNINMQRQWPQQTESHPINNVIPLSRQANASHG